MTFLLLLAFQLWSSPLPLLANDPACDESVPNTWRPNAVITTNSGPMYQLPAIPDWTLGLAQTEHERHRAIVVAFMRQTGYPHGRKGYVVDHIIPLCLGGPDSVENLQWQARRESYAKDRFERDLCRAVRAQGYKLAKNEPERDAFLFQGGQVPTPIFRIKGSTEAAAQEGDLWYDTARGVVKMYIWPGCWLDVKKVAQGARCPER